MRSRPASYRLSFFVPPACAGEGDLTRSIIRLDSRVCAEVLGPSREAVLNAAAQFLRSLGARDGDPIALNAILESPHSGPAGRDSWSIIIGADIAFSPTSLGPHLPPAVPQA